jgi:hypothetical protein
MGVRQLQPSQRTRAETLDRLDRETTAELDPALAVLRRCRPILEIVQRRSRVRGQLRRELSPAQDPARSPRLGPVNNPRLSRRAQIRFLDRRGGARRALAGTRVWQLKAGAEAEEAGVASNTVLREFPLHLKVNFAIGSANEKKEIE